MLNQTQIKQRRILKETLRWNYVASQDMIWDKVQRITGTQTISQKSVYIHLLNFVCPIYWEKVRTHFLTELCILHLRIFNLNKMQLGPSILNFVPFNSTYVCLQKFAATKMRCIYNSMWQKEVSSEPKVYVFRNIFRSHCTSLIQPGCCHVWSLNTRTATLS